MPTVTLNKTVFEELVGKTLPLEELKDRISMLGTDLEGIEGDEIHVEIFPNRPDLLSEQGFARAFSSFIGVNTGLKQYNNTPSNQKIIIDPSVDGVRPKTACAIIKNITIDEEKLREIIQIQEKLHVTFGRNRKKCAIGIYPLDKIVFPITYKADKPKNITFQPLDFPKAISADRILEEHPKGKEYAHLLEGKQKYPFFIDAADNILSMPPIINSQTIGCVTDETKDLFIECSGFDFNTLSLCLNMVVTALADMGGTIETLTLEYGKETKTTPNLTPKEMKLDLDYVNKRLGLNLKEQEAQNLLERMGFGYKDGNVLIPAYRSDILHQADFVEDIAIAYGYENFKEEIPNVSTIGEEAPLEKFAAKIRQILIGLQLTEAKNYHLATESDLNGKMGTDCPLIPLKNALGEQDHLRNAILPSLLKTLTINQHHEYPQNMFEIGRTFSPGGDADTGIKETETLAVTLCHETTDFTEIKQILQAFADNLGVEIRVEETDHPSYIAGRAANILINKKVIGVLGEIHPQVLTNWEIIVPVTALELNLETLYENIK